MNRWTLAALLVGLGLGYVLSESRRAPEPRRAGRAPEATRESAEPTRGPAPRRPKDIDAPPPTPPGVVEPVPETPVVAEEGEGLLRVEFAGLPDADPAVEIHFTDMEGRDDFEEHHAEEGTRVEVSWREGTYRVTWRDAGAMHRCEARVRMRADRATDIDASDPRYRLPEPPGLAVLTVRVPAAGGGLRADAWILVGGDLLPGLRWLDERTNRQGCARFRVRGGAYTVRLGTLEQPVTIGAGERRTVTLEHGARGDVMVEPAYPGSYVLWRNDTGSPFRSRRGRAIEVFVDEGEYELSYEYGYSGVEPPFRPGSAALGPIRVLAGKTTVYRHAAQPGVIVVELDLSKVPAADLGKPWSARVGRGMPAPLRETDDPSARRARYDRLEPGLQEVEIRCDGETRCRTTAVVGWDSTTRVKVAVSR